MGKNYVYTKKLVRGTLYLDKIARFKYNLDENEEVQIIEKPKCIEIRKINKE